MTTTDVRKDGVDRAPKFQLRHGMVEELFGLFKNPTNRIRGGVTINTWVRFFQSMAHELKILLDLFDTVGSVRNVLAATRTEQKKNTKKEGGGYKLFFWGHD